MREKRWERIFMDTERSLLRQKEEACGIDSQNLFERGRLKNFRVSVRMQEYQCVRQIFLFCTLGSEPQTASWMERFWRDGKSVTVLVHFRRPNGVLRVRRKRICSRVVMGFWNHGGMSARGPRRRYMDADAGTLFDGRGYRIGYGGGFYDRYMTRFPRLIISGWVCGQFGGREVARSPLIGGSNGW